MSWMNNVLILSLALIMAACGKTAATEKGGQISSDGTAGKPVQTETASGPRLSREPALNASPLGVEIGYANLSGVKQKLGSMTSLSEAGTSEHTGGKILMSDGQGLGVDGLTKLIAVFDKSETLVAVIMTMPKNVNSTYSKLSEKYKPVSKNVDEFMGFGTAKLEKGDSFIVLEAPHLSFAMDVVYATKAFMATSERNTAETRAKNEQEQKDKL